MPSSTRKTLQLLGEQHFIGPINPRSLTHDGRTGLIAAILATGDIDVYRSGGQRALHLDAADISGKAQCLEWARQGNILAIGTDEGIVQRVDVRVTKPTRRDQRQTRSVATGGHSVIGISTRASRIEQAPKLHASHEPLGTSNGADDTHDEPLDERMQDLGLDAEDLEAGNLVSLDLPRVLATMDVVSILPRLNSVAPPSKTGPGMPTPVIKAPRKEIQALLEVSTDRDLRNIAAVYTVLSDGSINAGIAELFQHNYKAMGQAPKAVYQSTNPDTGIHVLSRNLELVSGNRLQTRDAEIDLELYSPPFVRSENVHTGTIIRKTVELHAAGLYIAHAIETAVTDWSNLSTIPARFVGNVNESLEEKDEGVLDQHLIRALLTGHCSETVIEWLKDELGERGHKRWDTAMSTLFQSISNLLEVSIIPALERCAHAAASLRGLATYFEGSKTFDVMSNLFTDVVQTVSNLNLLACKALEAVSHEGPQFAAFSSWLRVRVDLAASEAGSNASLELIEAEATKTDIGVVLEYLQKGFRTSALLPFFGRRLSEAQINQELSDSATGLPDDREAALISGPAHNAFYLPLLSRSLQQRIDTCMVAVEHWQVTAWADPVIGSARLSAPLRAIDIKADAVASKYKPTTVRVSGIDAEAGIFLETRQISMAAPVDGKIKFPDDNELSSNITHLPTGYCFIDQTLDTKGGIIALVHQEAGDGPRTLLRFDALRRPDVSTDLTRQAISSLTVHEFDGSTPFKPSYLYVNEGRDSMDILVLDERCQHWQILRLPEDHADREGPRAGLKEADDHEIIIDQE